jgi:hypothetical protein
MSLAMRLRQKTRPLPEMVRGKAGSGFSPEAWVGLTRAALIYKFKFSKKTTFIIYAMATYPAKSVLSSFSSARPTQAGEATAGG